MLVVTAHPAPLLHDVKVCDAVSCTPQTIESKMRLQSIVRCGLQPTKRFCKSAERACHVFASHAPHTTSLSASHAAVCLCPSPHEPHVEQSVSLALKCVPGQWHDVRVELTCPFVQSLHAVVTPVVDHLPAPHWVCVVALPTRGHS